MPHRFLTSAPKSGSFWLFSALVGASLLLLLALTWQSVQAQRSNVKIVENLLADYAVVASEQFTRYINQYFGAWWSFQYGQIVIEHFEQCSDCDAGFNLPADALPTLAEAREGTAGIFRIDWPPGEVEVLEGTLTLPADTIVQAVEGRREKTGMFVLHLDGPGTQASLVAFHPLETSDRWYGIFFNPEEVNRRLKELALEYPLLPHAIAGDLERNEGIYISLRTPSGDVRFEANAETDHDLRSAYTFVEHPIDDTYRGLFSDHVVVTAIDPKLAERLVIGGLPSGRLPLLVTLLMLTASALAALFWVLLKERSLARMRNEFVARVSHEFRTPLTQIRMFAEALLLGRVRSEEDQQRQLKIIDREARRLGHMVSNVLTLSGRDHQTASTQVRPIEICELLDEIVNDYSIMLFGSRVRLTLAGCEKGESRRIRARVDPEAFKQVMLNLLDNARKYGPPEQEVRVTFECGPELCSVTVEDEGPGIPDSEKQRIFGLYHRLDRDEQRAINGTGIGLPIARELMQAMGGTCTIESASRGARFVIRFPRDIE